MTNVDTQAQPPPELEGATIGEAGTGEESIRLDRSPRGLPELRILAESWPRVAAAVLAISTGVGLWFWTRSVGLLLDWCGDAVLVANCVPPAGWVRNALLAVALPGIIAGVAATAYLAYFAVTGRTWRRWRIVSYLFSGFVLLWLAVFLVAVLVKG